MYVHNHSVTETQDCDFFNFFTNPKHHCCHCCSCVREPLNVAVVCPITVHFGVTLVIVGGTPVMSRSCQPMILIQCLILTNYTRVWYEINWVRTIEMMYSCSHCRNSSSPLDCICLILVTKWKIHTAEELKTVQPDVLFIVKIDKSVASLIVGVACHTWKHAHQWCHSVPTNPGVHFFITTAKLDVNTLRKLNFKMVLGCSLLQNSLILNPAIFVSWYFSYSH